jgi:Flp pilus assembly pilin Flp
MQKIMTLALEKYYQLRDRLPESRGQALVEYVLIGGGIAVAIVAALVLFVDDIEGALTDIGNAINP